ncbi:hypothetical protein Tco_0340071 [Tanacetum coccineum]
MGTIDGEGVDWTSHSEEEEDYALMACNSSGSDTKVTFCLNECKESYAKLKKLYDAQRELSDASIEIKAYTQGLKKVEAQLVAHQQGQLWLGYGDHSVETHESLPEPTVNEPKVVNQPKVWSDAPIIEEYESDSEDEHVSQPTKEQEQPSFASTNKQVKTPRETVKNQFTYSKNPTVDKKGLGYGFTARACFVCGSLSHLIRDCDFHEKRMAKQAELNNSMRKKSSQREIRPIWNNVQRVNHKNQFVPTAVLTRTGKIPVNTARASGTNNVSTARHNFNRQAVPTNAAMKVNTVKPIVNRVRPANLVLLGEKGKLLLSPQQVVIGDKKDITGKISPNTIVDQDYPHRALKHKGIVDSGCSRHMTGNKAYLAEYQDFNGGPVAFGGSKGYITGKGGLACLIARPPIEESNKMAIGGKQHRASCKAKSVSSISHSLQLLHMDLFGPTSIRSLNHKTYCLVIIDDFSRVSVTKPHNKIPYELFDGKSDEGFLVGYSLQSKAFRVYNLDTKRVEENLHITFLENKPNVARKGPTWLFDLDYLTDSMNYQPVRSENQTNKHAGPQEANQNAGTKDNIDAGDSEKEDESAQDYFNENSSKAGSSSILDELERLKRQEKDANDAAEALRKEFAQETEDLLLQARAAKTSSTNIVNTASTHS